jgi:hypothetical protein
MIRALSIAVSSNKKAGVVDPHWFQNADPDSDTALYLNADPDPGAKPMRILADPDQGQTLKSQKVKFLHEKYI